MDVKLPALQTHLAMIRAQTQLGFPQSSRAIGYMTASILFLVFIQSPNPIGDAVSLTRNPCHLLHLLPIVDTKGWDVQKGWCEIRFAACCNCGTKLIPLLK